MWIHRCMWVWVDVCICVRECNFVCIHAHMCMCVRVCVRMCMWAVGECDVNMCV